MPAEPAFDRFHERLLMQLARVCAEDAPPAASGRRRLRRHSYGATIVLAATIAASAAYAYSGGHLPGRDDDRYLNTSAQKLAELRLAERLLPPAAPGFAVAPFKSTVDGKGIYQAGVVTEAVLLRRACSWQMALIDAAARGDPRTVARAERMLARPVWYRYDDDPSRAYERRLLRRAVTGDLGGIRQTVRANCVGLVHRTADG